MFSAQLLVLLSALIPTAMLAGFEPTITLLTTDKNPNCSPCVLRVSDKSKQSVQIKLIQRPIHDFWETVSIKFKERSAKATEYTYPLKLSLSKLARNERDTLLSLDLNSDGYLDLALLVSEGARESQYYYFLYDIPSRKYLPLNPDEPLQLLEPTAEGLRPSGPYDPSRVPLYKIEKNKLILR